MKRWRRPRPSCEGKRRYSQRAAVAVARRNSAASGQALKPYHCEFGDHWHVGHVVPRFKRQAKGKSGRSGRSGGSDLQT